MIILKWGNTEKRFFCLQRKVRHKTKKEYVQNIIRIKGKLAESEEKR
jgi:hypothetical protein